MNKKQKEIEARKAADPIAQVMERDDIDYSSDELPTAPRGLGALLDGRVLVGVTTEKEFQAWKAEQRTEQVERPERLIVVFGGKDERTQE